MVLVDNGNHLFAEFSSTRVKAVRVKAAGKPFEVFRMHKKTTKTSAKLELLFKHRPSVSVTCREARLPSSQHGPKSPQIPPLIEVPYNLPRALEGSNEKEPSILQSNIPIWYRLSSPKVDLFFGSSQGSGDVFLAF